GAGGGDGPREEGRPPRPGEPLYDRIEDVVEDRLAVLVRGVGVGEIASRAEAPALTPEHECPRPGVPPPAQALVEIGDHRLVDGVHLVGPVEYQFGERVVDLEPDGSVAPARHRSVALIRRRAVGPGRSGS